MFSTRYPQVNHNLWIKFLECGFHIFSCGNDVTEFFPLIFDTQIGFIL